MKIRTGTAFGLGVVAALVITLVMILVRSANFSGLNLEMTIGALVTGSAGPLSWAVGLIIHLLAGGMFAVAYACIFEAVGAAGWRRGVFLSALHALLAGMILTLVPAVQAETAAYPRLHAPGFMGAGYGSASVAWFLAIHALLGLIVGGGYRVRGRTRRSPMSHGPA